MPRNNTAVLEARDLTAIDKVIYSAPDTELPARKLLNVKSDVPAGAATYEYKTLTKAGSAKVIADGDSKLPLVDADLKDFSQKIVTFAAGIQYSEQELREAQMTGLQVDATKAAVARRAIFELENKIAFTGDKKHGIPGFANADNIQVTTSSKGGTAAKFENMDPADIVEEFRAAKSLITSIAGYRNTELSVAISSDQYEILQRRYSDYDARTTLQVIKESGWFTNILPVFDLKGVGTDGTDSMLIFDPSPTVAQLIIPMDITRVQQEFQWPNIRVPFEERCGGVVVRTPYAIVRVDGI